MPYVVLGDEAFPLQIHLMRPFPGKKCSYGELIFNYRLSRARRLVENAFGILAQRWRVFHTKIGVAPKLVTKIVKATCVLHNLLQSQSTPAQIVTLLEDADRESHGMRNLKRSGNRGSKNAEEIRDKFMDYFLNDNVLEWQHDHVTRGKFTE